jgi:tetratricopeptide (TPR) repeat protein
MNRIATLTWLCAIAACVGGCQTQLTDDDRAARLARWQDARAQMRLRLVEDQLADGRFNEADAELAAAIELNPESVRAATLSARLALARGELAAAREWLNRAEPKAAGEASFHELSGVVYAASGDAERALEAFSVAAELAPTDDGLAMTYARGLLTVGRYDDARAFLETNEPRLAGYGEFYELLGDIYLALDEAWSAADRYGTAAQFGTLPRHSAEVRAFLLLELGRFPEAVRVFEELIEGVDEPSTSLRAGLARAMLGAGKAREARQELGLLLRANDDDAGLWKLMAEATAATGDLEAAVLAAERAVALSPEDATAQQLLAALAAKNKQWELADAAARHALRIAPDDELSVMLAAWIDARLEVTPGNTPVALEEPSVRRQAGKEAE